MIKPIMAPGYRMYIKPKTAKSHFIIDRNFLAKITFTKLTAFIVRAAIYARQLYKKLGLTADFHEAELNLISL